VNNWHYSSGHLVKNKLFEKGLKYCTSFSLRNGKTYSVSSSNMKLTNYLIAHMSKIFNINNLSEINCKWIRRTRLYVLFCNTWTRMWDLSISLIISWSVLTTVILVECISLLFLAMGVHFIDIKESGLCLIWCNNYNDNGICKQ
jgi:hypothetical protein